MQNLALEHAGVEARVDHRSLAAQGIHREPEVHRGPAVSGIEARGEVSEVGERQREQMRLGRKRGTRVVAEVRVVTREEVAAERVAVRERRELAREVTGADRAVVLPLVEADRREQLGRAQAAAERRVERRQGLGIGGARREITRPRRGRLRERIGQQLGRVQGVGAGAVSGSVQADQRALAGSHGYGGGQGPWVADGREGQGGEAVRRPLARCHRAGTGAEGGACGGPAGA